jgi:hypothetical protein
MTNTTIDIEPSAVIKKPEAPVDTVIPGELTGANARASWRFSADHIQQALAHCSPERKEALIWCFNWCIQRGIWFAEFAAQVGYAENTLYKIYTGRHNNPGTGERYDIPEKLFKATADFKKLEIKKAKLGETEFVHTPLVRRVWNACDLARESRTPVFLYGSSHIGKTWALRHYTLEHNHGRTVLIRVPSKDGLGGLIKAIAAGLGISTKANTPAMIERIKKALAPNHLLIFDELHQLQYTYRKESFFACIEVIRELYDHVECGMVFCTTNVFRGRFESARKEELEQIFKRGVHRVQLGDIVRAEDLKVILERSGLSWPGRRFTIEIADIKDQPHEIIRKLSREEGLKSITERIRYGRLLADKASEQLAWKHFTHAHLIIENNSRLPKDDWE